MHGENDKRLLSASMFLLKMSARRRLFLSYPSLSPLFFPARNKPKEGIPHMLFPSACVSTCMFMQHLIKYVMMEGTVSPDRYCVLTSSHTPPAAAFIPHTRCPNIFPGNKSLQFVSFLKAGNASKCEEKKH